VDSGSGRTAYRWNQVAAASAKPAREELMPARDQIIEKRMEMMTSMLQMILDRMQEPANDHGLLACPCAYPSMVVPEAAFGKAAAEPSTQPGARQGHPGVAARGYSSIRRTSASSRFRHWLLSINPLYA
jgi:hypothetical protein